MDQRVELLSIVLFNLSIMRNITIEIQSLFHKGVLAKIECI